MFARDRRSPEPNERAMHPETLMVVPDLVLETIFSYLSYDEIAKNRLVCTRFDQIGSRMLNKGFLRIEKFHASLYRKVKAVLPRRESERKVHPLARNCEILASIDTRISMLNMTYFKYIDRHMCCFIPGKVIDELQHILYFLKDKTLMPDWNPPRTHELLQELRDISSMAMEHFDETVIPLLKRRNPTYDVQAASAIAIIHQQRADDLHKVMSQCKVLKHQLMSFVQLFNRMIPKFRIVSRRLREKSNQVNEQRRLIDEQAAKCREHENAIADMKKHVEELDQKYADLSSELTRVRDDCLLKTPTRSSSGGSNVDANFQPVRSLLPPDLIAPGILAAATGGTPPYTPQSQHHHTRASVHGSLRPRKSISRYVEGSLSERKRKIDPLYEAHAGTHKVPRLAEPSTRIPDCIHDKIDENITRNISKNIRDCGCVALPGGGQHLPQQFKTMQRVKTFLSNSLGSFLKSPTPQPHQFSTQERMAITTTAATPLGLASRKRKAAEDIVL